MRQASGPGKQVEVGKHTNRAVRRRVFGGMRGVAVALVALAILVVGAGCASGAGSGVGSGSSATATAAVPTATPTREQRITALARQAAGSDAHTVEATFGAGSADDGKVTVAVTVAGPVPATQEEINAAQERVKAISFRVEQALWTSGMPLNEVVVTVVGPIYDDYADLTTGAYGAVDLKAATAAKLAWASLNPDTAWNVYQVWLRPAYRSKVLGQ